MSKKKVFDGEHVDIWQENTDGQSTVVVCIGRCNLYLSKVEFEELSHGATQLLCETNQSRGDIYR